MKAIETERLRILPLSLEELAQLVEDYKDSIAELSQAYGEMLRHCQEYPDQYLWYAPWKIYSKTDHCVVGYAGFQGLQKDGGVEIGYGMEEAYEGKGYATEGVKALCNWAFCRNRVAYIEAETAVDHIASQKVLGKAGFKPTGKVGREGPKFVLFPGGSLA